MAMENCKSTMYRSSWFQKNKNIISEVLPRSHTCFFNCFVLAERMILSQLSWILESFFRGTHNFRDSKSRKTKREGERERERVREREKEREREIYIYICIYRFIVDITIDNYS